MDRHAQKQPVVKVWALPIDSTSTYLRLFLGKAKWPSSSPLRSLYAPKPSHAKPHSNYLLGRLLFDNSSERDMLVDSATHRCISMQGHTLQEASRCAVETRDTLHCIPAKYDQTCHRRTLLLYASCSTSYPARRLGSSLKETWRYLA